MDAYTEQRKRRRLRNVISWILSFILCLFLTLLALLVMVQTTLLSPSFFKAQVEKSGYTAHVIEDMEEIFVSYGMSSGFDEAFFTSVLDESEVRADIDMEIDRLYTPGLSGADVDGFQNKLMDKLLENVRARDIEVTDEVTQAVAYLAEVCAQTYGEGVRLPLASYAAGALRTLRTPVLTAMAVFALLSLFVFFFLFSLRRRKTFCRYAIYATSGTALLLLAPAVLILLSGRIDKIGLTGKALYFLATTYVQQLVYMLLALAGVMAILTALLAVCYILLCRRDKKRSRRHDRYYVMGME